MLVMAGARRNIHDYARGTAAPWYRGWEITDAKREFFRQNSLRSSQAKQRALDGDEVGTQPINIPTFDPATLMPETARHELAALSLFSGGGGLDLGFDRAGYTHVASYDTLEAGGATLVANRPTWNVFAGADGDVRATDWRRYRSDIDVLHGGPPCQPFSSAGRQLGHEDERNLIPEFVRCVRQVRPAAFVAENVSALAGPKFAGYLKESLYGPLERAGYRIVTFKLSAHEFGVPQLRHRVFFVGFRRQRDFARFVPPTPTHRADLLHRGPASAPSHARLDATVGVRAALGLLGDHHGLDALAPTLRSTLTGPRHTTSILSSVSAQKVWAALGIWPNGVAATRDAASAFPAGNGHFRLSVPDCALLQGFPESWSFHGAVYMALGQIGNSVAPPVAYRVALAVARALSARSAD
jgi:DNA (cytosine-5)-methyltransferase 1